MSELNKNREIVFSIVDKQKTPPILTVPIADALGITVYDVSGWKDRLSGMIRKEVEDGGKSGYAIYVNASHPKTRRRFTIAHEIAHYVLHKSLIGDGIVDDTLYCSDLSDTLEAEANQFAAGILMPIHLIRRAFRNERSMPKLAEQFDVSREAMAIRLYNANYISAGHYV